MRPHHKFWPARLPHAITPPATSLWQNLSVSAMRSSTRCKTPKRMSSVSTTKRIIPKDTVHPSLYGFHGIRLRRNRRKYALKTSRNLCGNA